MNYIYDQDSIINLINITERIYLTYKKILDVKFKDDDYYRIIGELIRLSKIEDDILLSLPKNIRVLDNINNSIRNIYSRNNYLMYNFVLNRIDSNICNLCALVENEELLNISNISFIDSQYNINSINDELYFDFILRLNNVISDTSDIGNKRKIRFIQLGYIFSFKNISDAFINNNLCLESNLIERRENSYSDVESYNSFMNLKNTLAFDLCERILMRNITLSSYFNENHNSAFYLSNLLLFKSSLQELNDSDFMEIRNIFSFDYETAKANNLVIRELKQCFDLEYDRRFSIEKNDIAQVLDSNCYDNLITLIRLEDTLYDKIMSLKLDGFDNFKLISSLIRYEKDLLDELDVNMGNASVISPVIFRDLEFFIDLNGNTFKEKAIIKRLKNSFDYFKKFDYSEGIVEKNYDSIISNHIVDSLKKYNGDLSVFKYYLYMYPSLTADFALMNGNYLERFSDETTSLSLGNRFVNDYYYDKNEQLYKLFTDIVDDLTRFSDMYESDWASLLDFKICELSDIIDSVSDEHLYDIKSEILSLDESVVKNKILSLFKNKVY